MKRSMFWRRTTAKLGGSALLLIQPIFRNKKTAAEAEEVGAKLGRLLYRLPLFKKKRLLATRNIAFAMPELSAAECESLTLKTFEHFGRLAGDFFWSPNRTNEEVLATMEAEGIEYGFAAQAKAMGIIAVTAHFGNWERFGHWFCAYGGKITVVARDANDGALQDSVQKIRANTGMNVLSRGRSTRALVELLKQGEVLGLLPDQNSNEAYLPFFGKPTGTVLGPAKLQRLTKAPLVPAFCARIGPGRYKMIVKPEIVVTEEDTYETVMARYNAVLEEVIREYPDQYMWLHDRWKSARREGLV